MAGGGRERLLTVTHARVRIAQGDFAGARRVLRELLGERPGNLEASRLLEEIGGRADRARSHGEQERLAGPRSAEARALVGSFRRALGRPAGRRRRIERLEAWLNRIARGASPAP